ncbi:MAG: hypothetical protein ACLFN8_00730 [Candidatus Woesearchaeota archaeon]
MFKQKKAVMGVGMLLIFVASIVSAAIAAALLITSTNLLQDRAAKVQQDATEGLISGLDVVSIYATGNMTTEIIYEFEFITRLRAGSRPAQLDSLGLTFIQGENTATGYMNTSLIGDNCTFENLQAETEFCVNKIFGDENTVLESGDMAIIKYKLSNESALPTDTPFDIIFQLRVGSPLIMALQTPDMVLSSKIRLR